MVKHDSYSLTDPPTQLHRGFRADFCYHNQFELDSAIPAEMSLLANRKRTNLPVEEGGGSELDGQCLFKTIFLGCRPLLGCFHWILFCLHYSVDYDCHRCHILCLSLLDYLIFYFSVVEDTKLGNCHWQLSRLVNKRRRRMTKLVNTCQMSQGDDSNVVAKCHTQIIN